MAMEIENICDKCDHSIQAWSDGNPYYLDLQGKKQYAYHPDHFNLDRCIGNDSEHLCLNCAAKLVLDSRKPIKACPECKSGDFQDTYQLEGKRCPFCKDGTFRINPDHICVS
ncbi:hypothetical protein OAA19_00200 [Rubripirellula sp.]|jgi:DNA-directed RNA polymerase subunit RPC12/RpoP|nr:hypothetical protein [Rubripirellula sp.]MDB4338507.1 hypothetical protein [Rubripirellula sp.]